MGSIQNQTIEATTLDGRNALLVRPSVYGAVTYVLGVADRIFVVAYQNTYNDTSGVPTLERMARSFHLLTDQERAAAPTPAPVPARSIEMVADSVADGLARQDVDLLATVMAPCMAAALEQAGGTFVPRAAFAQQLREAFAAGLRVTVQRRPIESDETGLFIRATWNAAAEQQRDIYFRHDGDVWTWFLTLTRQPVR